MQREDGASSDRGWTGWRRLMLGCAALVAVILFGWTLSALAIVIVPVIFAAFLALLVAPVDRWGTEHAPPKMKWLGHVAAMSTILLVLLVLIGTTWISAQRIIDRFPIETETAQNEPPQTGSNAEPAGGGTPAVPTGGGAPEDAPSDTPPAAALAGDQSGGGLLSRVRTAFDDAGKSLGARFAEWASSNAMSILNMAGTTLGLAVIVFFLTLMMLVEAPHWQNKISNMASKGSRQDIFGAIQTIASLLRRYLLVRTILGVITAALYVGWLWIFGIDLLIVWAFLAFALNYVPNIGSLIGGLLPVAYAFVQKDPGTALAVGAGLFVIEQVMGNYVDPRIQGQQVSLSSLVILVALMFWAWMWGIAGAFLAVPMTITVLIVSAHVAPLRPLALFLSNETDYEGLDRMALR